MTRIIVVRHGQTEWNRVVRFRGVVDVPLNETGLAQARAVGRRLASLPISAVYSSPLSRAIQTAEAIARPVALSTLVLMGFGWPRVEKAVQVLETSEGVRLLRSEGDDDRHEFTPTTGKAALQAVCSLAREAYSAVT